MASTSAVSMAMPLNQTRIHSRVSSANSFFNPLPLKASKSTGTVAVKCVRKIEASMKETVVKGLTAAAVTASVVVPEAAMAASGVSPSLKNFLLSIGSGGVVAVGIIGVVLAISTFDPVERTD